MVNCPEKYSGLKAGVAREEVVKDLESAGLLKKVEKIHHTVGTCYRDHSILEPMISTQWFIKVEPLTKKVLLAIKNKDVKFAAKKYEKIAIHWLKNLRDWNISRQIVWGMRIPAWVCDKCLKWTVTGGNVPERCDHCGHDKLVQDTDTFDTWFSSSQWPFVTLMTNQKDDFKKFYPTSVMETGYDILPIWVVRMLMLGIYVTGKVPFENVLLHGLVRDREGQKISKSKGNVINPIEMADKYGADSLRMGLLWGAIIENDIALSEENINAQRKFSNKVWNATRFVSSFTAESKFNNQFNKHLSEIIKKTTKSLNEFKLNQAAELLYSEFWHWYCDKCIENSKKGEIGAKQLKDGLVIFLKLLHPFMPFVTEQIWHEMGNKQSLPSDGKNLLMTSQWPKAS
jgi:valyl-tRNA synthetase